MKPSLLAVALRAACEVTEEVTEPQPVMVWGPPGVGKSSIVKQVADELFGKQKVKVRTTKLHVVETHHFIDLRLPLLDAVDLRGIPTVDGNETRWIPPSFLPKEGKGILFLDELVQAMPIVQSAASQLILDRRIGDYRLPDGWVVVAAGNRDTDRASTNKMPSHIANRFMHLTLDVHHRDWLDWAIEKDLHPMVIAFIAWRSELLHSFDPKRRENATPRTWEFVSRMMKKGISDEVFMEVISGLVGEGPAREFVGFTKIFRNLPDYKDIVGSPTTVKLPADSSVLYAITTMLSLNTTKKDIAAVFKYVSRMQKEYQLLCVMNITRKNPELCETLTYIQWTSENKEILLNAA